MYSNVIVFENKSFDAKRIINRLSIRNCNVKVISHCDINEIRRILNDYKPDIAIVDSKFNNYLDGLQIVKLINELYPKIPIIICSILLNKKNAEKYYNIYNNLECVKRIYAKKPFPTTENLLLETAE